MKIVRSILAGLLGMFVGGLGVSLVQMISTSLYRPPAEIDTNNWDQMREWVQTLPTPAFLLVLASWATGSFLGPWVSRRLTPGRAMAPSLIVWLLFFAATLFTLFAIPHPMWMWPSGIVVCLAMGFLGFSLAGPGRMAVETTRLIDAPLPKVFKVLADVRNFSHAVEGIKDIRFLTDQEYGVGTRFVETRIMNGREAATELEVTELQEDQYVRLVSHAGGTCWDTVFTVNNNNGLVEMHMRMDVIPANLLSRAMTPMILGMVSKAIEDDMDAVKAFCEASS